MKIVWRIGKRFAGGTLIVLGVVGLVLPGIQGIACILLGAYLLGFEREHMVSGLKYIERRVPFLAGVASRIRLRLERRPSSAGP